MYSNIIIVHGEDMRVIYLILGIDQRIYIYREGTAPPLVFNKSVFFLRKPEALSKTTTSSGRQY